MIGLEYMVIKVNQEKESSLVIMKSL